MVVNRAIFLDKDGTLIPDIPYNVNVELISLSAHAIEGLQLLQRLGYIFIVITNQPGICKGLFSDGDVMAVNDKLEALLADAGIKLSGFYYCPHDPASMKTLFGLNCKCRKPKPGMLHRASRELNIDLSSSWVIGDILHDVEAGNTAGCKTILINNGNETEWIVNDERTPDMIVAHINAASAYIFEMDLQKITYQTTVC